MSHRRDIRREKMTQQLESFLLTLVSQNALFFESAQVVVESDGHLTLTYSPELPIPTIYDIRISRRKN